MKAFYEKTAVITGAGSGIGRSFAYKAASLGMNLVLADINEKDLSTVQEELISKGAKSLAVPTDVSKIEAIENLASETEKQFGKVHLLFNNAGVTSVPKPIWESSLEDWQWVIGVNLESVIYGVKTFVPEMLEHGEPAHIINTASIAGLIANSRMNTYGVTKHAVVALSENLLLDLQEAEANIGVSVFCPAWIKTQIHSAERNRPAELKNVKGELSPSTQKAASVIMKAMERAMDVDEAIEVVFEAIKNETFYILTHEPFKKFIRERMENIVAQNSPKATW